MHFGQSTTCGQKKERNGLDLALLRLTEQAKFPFHSTYKRGGTDKGFCPSQNQADEKEKNQDAVTLAFIQVTDSSSNLQQQKHVQIMN